MNVYGLTDIGRRRDNNQDCFKIVELENAAAVIVCDGMGGANGGSVASQTAAEAIAERISSAYRSDMPPRSIKNMICSAVMAANISVFDKSVQNPSLSGMGTTTVTAIIRDKTVFVAHVGDSRAYVAENGMLSQLTRDHSIVQQMIEDGQITGEEAKTHPKRNIITRAVGVSESVEIDYSQYDFDDNNYLLVCTDGLSGYVSNEQILDILMTYDLEQCPRELINAANNNGGGDNITAVVAAI